MQLGHPKVLIDPAAQTHPIADLNLGAAVVYEDALGCVGIIIGRVLLEEKPSHFIFGLQIQGDHGLHCHVLPE